MPSHRGVKSIRLRPYVALLLCAASTVSTAPAPVLPKAAVAVPKSKPAADGTSKKAAAVPAAVAASSTAPTRAAPPAPPPPPPPPAPPPPPPPDPKMVAAEAAIAKLFKDQRSEDLPLEMVKGAAGLADGDLDTLLKKMDDENKLMCRAGSVYLI